MLYHLVYFQKDSFLMDQNDTHSWRASGRSSEVRVLNCTNCDVPQQENLYHLKVLDHLDQIQLKIHCLTDFKCGYQTQVLGKVAFPPIAPRIWGARATAVALARQWLGEAVGYGQRQVISVDPILSHALVLGEIWPQKAMATKLGLHRSWLLVWLPRSGLSPYDKPSLLMLKNKGPWLCELDWVIFKVFSMEG